MLAALIATRQNSPVPPPVPVFFYSNQLVAAVNTFTCITVARRAAAITTSLPIQHQLSLSIQGAPSILDLLNLRYYRIVNYLSSDANMISAVSNLYLSDQIAAVILSATALQNILTTLPVMSTDFVQLVGLQQQLAISLAILKSLGIRVN